MRATLMAVAGWFIGLIGGALLALIMGYWSSGSVVGFGGVGVYGWVAALFLMFMGSLTGAVSGFGWQWLKLWPFSERKLLPIGPALPVNRNETVVKERNLAELTAEAGRCALFFRGILAEDTQAQVLIDELLVRATRAACGVKTDADYQVQISKSGGVNFTPKAEE